MFSIKDSIFQLRNWLWNYPDKLERLLSPAYKIIRGAYLSFRPFSLIIPILLISLITIKAISPTTFASFDNLLNNDDRLIEGIVISKDYYPENLNPIFATTSQIEKDLRELIFSSLFTVDNEGVLQPDLVDSWSESKDKKTYEISLKKNVYWHDGEKMTVDDVFYTINLLKEYGTENIYGEVLQEVEYERKDDYSFILQLKNVNPTFVESLIWGVLPRHKLEGLTPNEIKRAKFNLTPVGTGPYALSSINDDRVILTANKSYFKGEPKIGTIQFNIYYSEDVLLNDIARGRVHSVFGESDDTENAITDTYSNMKVYKSDPLYKRYWALYFNMSEGAKNSSILKDPNIREAFALGIDVDSIIKDIVKNNGERAYGTIAKTSWAFDEDLLKEKSNREAAEKILDQQDWKKGADGIRTKNGKRLELSLLTIGEPIKLAIADNIKGQLKDLGVLLNVEVYDNDYLVNNNIATRNFDILFYGIETSADPDRFPLWHSSQKQFPGLNLSSYESDIIDGRTEKSRVDILLENGRSEIEQKERIKTYNTFQKYLSSENPAIFIYHPKISYVANQRVKNIDIKHISSAEYRFWNVESWEIVIN